MIGVDEAGRGAWAGALVAAAVRLCNVAYQHLLSDSKKLRPGRRQALAQLLQADDQVEIAYGVASASLIDEQGLTAAQQQAMGQAIAGLQPQSQEIIILDGKINYVKTLYPASRAQVAADASQPAVMAASILAKVYRDEQLRSLESLYPGYGFAQHKGYGTAEHRRALKALGALTAVHRFSFRPLRQFTKSAPERLV